MLSLQKDGGVRMRVIGGCILTSDQLAGLIATKEGERGRAGRAENARRLNKEKREEN
jgi:hypothetical protein